MRIGLDFDNTIVNYDHAFHAAALAQGLIDATLAATKQSVKDFLCQKPDGNAVWTRLQAEVYGKTMLHDASLNPGFVDFVKKARSQQHELFIVSHKTTKPALGPEYDLHAVARQWLEQNGFFKELGFVAEQVFFEVTLSKKLARAEALGCDVFIDDLQDVLLHKEFPKDTKAVWYHKQEKPSAHPGFFYVGDWPAITEEIL